MKNLLKSVTLVSFLFIAAISCQKQQIEKIVTTEEEVGEAPAENLTKKSPITAVAYGPDLVVSSVTTTLPSVPTTTCGGPGLQAFCGVQYTSTIIVKNIGNAAVTNSYHLRLGYLENGVLLQSHDFQSPSSSLAPGASHVFNIPPAPYASCSGSPSIKQLMFFADIYNDVAETNESNNRSNPIKYCGD